jgi:photosystem II stability/assembly factor-like uncharacterized protein
MARPAERRRWAAALPADSPVRREAVDSNSVWGPQAWPERQASPELPQQDAGQSPAREPPDAPRQASRQEA